MMASSAGDTFSYRAPSPSRNGKCGHLHAFLTMHPAQSSLICQVRVDEASICESPLGTRGMSLTTRQASSEPEKGIKGKLLIVDDETAIRWALRNTLQRMNFEIVEAETGEQA